MSFLELMDNVFGKLFLTLGALLVCVFVGWHVRARPILASIRSDKLPHTICVAWRLSIRFLCPVVIVIILIGVLGGLAEP